MPDLLPIHWEDYTRSHPIGYHLVYAVMGDGEITFPGKPAARPPSQTFCDFCLGVVAPGASLAVFKDVRAKIRIPGMEAWWIDGPFGACRSCQVRLGIRPGDYAVELDKVRRLFKSEANRVMRESDPEMARWFGTGEVEFYGPG